MLALNIQSLKYFQLKTVNIIAYMTVSVTFTKKKSVYTFLNERPLSLEWKT